MTFPVLCNAMSTMMERLYRCNLRTVAVLWFHVGQSKDGWGGTKRMIITSWATIRKLTYWCSYHSQLEEFWEIRDVRVLVRLCVVEASKTRKGRVSPTVLSASVKYENPQVIKLVRNEYIVFNNVFNSKNSIYATEPGCGWRSVYALKTWHHLQRPYLPHLGRWVCWKPLVFGEEMDDVPDKCIGNEKENLPARF